MANNLVQRKSDPVIEEMRQQYYAEPESSYSPLTQSIAPVIELGMDATAAIVSHHKDRVIQLVEDQKERVWDRVSQKGEENYELTMENNELRYQLRLAEIERKYGGGKSDVVVAGTVFSVIFFGLLAIL